MPVGWTRSSAESSMHQAGDVVVLPLAGAEDLREQASPIPEQPPFGAGGLLLGAKLFVAELLEHDSHGLRVVARVVEKARRRLVRELVD